MRCPSCGLPALDLLAFADGELPAGREGEVRSALADCPACRRRLAGWRRTAGVLRVATPPRDDPIGRAALRARLERAAARERGGRWRRAAATAAALPLLVLLLLAAADRFDLPLPGSCPDCDPGAAADRLALDAEVSRPSRPLPPALPVVFRLAGGAERWPLDPVGYRRGDGARGSGERWGPTGCGSGTASRCPSDPRTIASPSLLRLLPPGYPVPGCGGGSPLPVVVGNGAAPCR